MTMTVDLMFAEGRTWFFFLFISSTFVNESSIMLSWQQEYDTLIMQIRHSMNETLLYSDFQVSF